MSDHRRSPRFSCLGRFIASLGLGLLPGTASAYDVFNPTPTDELREMATDRPDTTECAQTVDSGRIQFEMDLLVVGLDDRAESQSRSLSLLPINMKVGLADAVDLQIVVAPFEFARETALGVSTDSLGYGSTTARLKINLWGNDGGDTQMALLPFVTHTPDLGAVEGGLAIPFGVALPAGFGLGAMLEGDLVRSDTGDYEAEGLATMTVGHDIVGPLGMWLEAAAYWRPYHFERSAFRIHTGFNVDLGGDTIFDGGARFGVLGPEADAEVFMGISFRR